MNPREALCATEVSGATVKPLGIASAAKGIGAIIRRL
jgi:hypothetical protein